MVVSLYFHYHPLIDGLSYFIKHEYFGPTCSNRRTVWNLSTIISDVKNVIVFEENFKLATDMTEIIYLLAQFVHFSIYLIYLFIYQFIHVIIFGILEFLGTKDGVLSFSQH